VKKTLVLAQGTDEIGRTTMASGFRFQALTDITTVEWAAVASGAVSEESLCADPYPLSGELKSTQLR
jgi:hypothetical protein